MTAGAWHSRLNNAWRGALLVGSIHLLVSAPFLVGVLTPSLHEGNLYAFTYVILNVPVIGLLGGFSDGVCRLVFGERHTLYQAITGSSK